MQNSFGLVLWKEIEKEFSSKLDFYFLGKLDVIFLSGARNVVEL